VVLPICGGPKNRTQAGRQNFERRGGGVRPLRGRGGGAIRQRHLLSHWSIRRAINNVGTKPQDVPHFRRLKAACGWLRARGALVRIDPGHSLNARVPCQALKGVDDHPRRRSRLRAKPDIGTFVARSTSTVPLSSPSRGAARPLSRSSSGTSSPA